MKRGVCISGLAVLLILAVSVGANASVQSALSWLSIDPDVISKLEDTDFEVMFIDNDSDGNVDVGDVLAGVYEVAKIWKDASDFGTVQTPSAASGDANFTAFFAIQVDTKAAGGLGTKYGFEPVSDANWASLVTAVGIPTRSDSSTALLLYDDDDPDSNSWIEVYDATSADIGDGRSGVEATVDSATDGTLLWEFGFDVDGDEFWDAETDTDALATLVDLIYDAGLNVTKSFSIDLTEHDVLSFGGDYDLELFGSSDGIVNENWLVTNTDLYINAVPEAASVFVWGGLAATIGLLGMIRRRRAGV